MDFITLIHTENTDALTQQVMFDGEDYALTRHSDGSKTLYKERNRSGFKITIKVTGDSEEHKKAIDAVKDFYIKGNNL